MFEYNGHIISGTPILKEGQLVSIITCSAVHNGDIYYGLDNITASSRGRIELRQLNWHSNTWSYYNTKVEDRWSKITKDHVTYIQKLAQDGSILQTPMHIPEDVSYLSKTHHHYVDFYSKENLPYSPTKYVYYGFIFYFIFILDFIFHPVIYNEIVIT